MDTETGCQDVDECQSGPEVHKCDPDTKFCVNTEGSHRCMKCDKSCKGCFADGPDSCTDCANGYVFQKNKDSEEDGHGSTGICITEKEAAEKEKEANEAKEESDEVTTENEPTSEQNSDISAQKSKKEL